MHDPSFGANVVHGGKVGFDKSSEVKTLLVVLDRFVGESSIVVGVETATD